MWIWKKKWNVYGNFWISMLYFAIPAARPTQLPFLSCFYYFRSMPIRFFYYEYSLSLGISVKNVISAIDLHTISCDILFLNGRNKQSCLPTARKIFFFFSKFSNKVILFWNILIEVVFL